MRKKSGNLLMLMDMLKKNKKLTKCITSAMLAAVMLILQANPAMAESAEYWKKDSKGSRYVYSDSSGSESYTHGWKWLPADKNRTGYATKGEYRRYYFNHFGYLVANGTTPDGHRVNKDGEMLENGKPVKAYGMILLESNMTDTGDAIIVTEAWVGENPTSVRFDSTTLYTEPDPDGLTPFERIRDDIAQERDGKGMYASAWYLLKLTGEHVDEIIYYGHWD